MSKNSVINKVLVMSVLSAAASASHAGVEIDVNSKNADEEIVGQVKSILNAQAPSVYIASNFDLLKKQLKLDGKALDVKLASTNDSTDGRSTSSCYSNCYSNCHSACHGSRGWR